MCPRDALNDIANSNPGDAELVSQGCERFAIGGATPDCPHIVFGQVRSSVALAPRQCLGMGGVDVAPLGEHIAHIVGSCAKEQVSWVDTLGIVAPMTHVQARRYWPVRQLPGEAMGAYVAVPAAASVDQAIPGRMQRSGPKPTLIRTVAAINFRPKPLCNWGILGVHYDLPCRCATPPAVCSSAEASYTSYCTTFTHIRSVYGN